MSKRLVHIEVVPSRIKGETKVTIADFYDMNTCKTLVKARDFLIKRARAEYIATKDREDESAYTAISKFNFGKDLVGYYHFDDGLNFLFEEGHPVFQLVVAGKHKDPRFAEGLYDLYQTIRDANRERVYTLIGINRKTGVAHPVYIGRGEASFEDKDEALEYAADGTNSDTIWKVVQVFAGWEWKAAENYNKANNLVDA